MFESIIATLLNKYLSEYIDAVDYNNLKIGLFTGSLELLDIKIKPSALYQFDLPIEVKYGRIGKLKINLSWRKIMSEAAVLEIEDLFVLCGPFEDKIHDPNQIEEIFVAHKRKQLQEIEKIDEAQLFEDNDEQSYTEMITNTIINNIQVYIKNIHIRYEDKYSIKNKIVSFGIYLKELRAETVDANGKPNFLNADEKVIYKMGKLSGFNVYWNCNNIANSLIIQQKEFERNRDYCVKFLKESIDTGEINGVPFEKFLEKNLSLEMRLTLRRSIDVTVPKIICQSSVSAIEFLFQRTQYKNIIAIIDYYSFVNVHKQFVKYRPQEIETIKNVKDRAKLYWKFAFVATAESKWRHYKRDRMLKHWRSYREYIAKYQIKLKNSSEKKETSAQELKILENLEKELTLESILDAREYCNDMFRAQKLNDGDVQVQEEKDERPESRPMNYVEFQLILNFPLIGLRLINRNHDILRLNFTQIIARFETRPVAKSIYFLMNTQSIDANGIYYKDTLKNVGAYTKLVPLIRSKETNVGDLLIDTESHGKEQSDEMFFTLAFETNPIHIEPEVEFSIRTRVQSLEVYYEKTCITELLNFFKSDTFGIENVVNIRKIQENVWSKAGVIFAVENHKQFHVSAELSSPYFVIPGKGTMQESGDSIVFFLGKTLIQSDLQKKTAITSTTTIEQLENNFYDKLKLSVNEVQVMLLSYDILKNYLESGYNYDFKYHLLYPVSTDNVVYLSIDPKYKKLPKLKINATCPSIRLNFSDNKIIKLFNFAQNFPLPTMPKYAPLPAPISPVIAPIQPNSASTKIAKPIDTKKTFKESKQKDKKKNKKKSEVESDSDDESDDDEWEGPFASPKKINGNPIPNYSQLLFKFKINDFMIDIKGTNDLISDEPIENDYLGLILNAIKLDFSITKFGFALKAGLGNLRLLDKVHRSRTNHFTEFLSSTSTEELIQLRFRQVEPETPNFEKLYSRTLSKILFKCSKIQVVCHRTAIIYFINFAIKLTDKITIKKTTIPTESIEAIDDSPPVISSPTVNTDMAVKKVYQNNESNIIELNIEAIMNELTWKMYDNDLLFGNMQVKDLCATYCLSNIKTDLHVTLKTIYINYESDELDITSSTKSNLADISDQSINEANTNETVANKILKSYKQIISCTAEKNSENFFDFKLIFFDISGIDKSSLDLENFKDSILLNIGQIRVICLVKFVNELIDFIEPIINPLPNLATQIKDQAIEAANMVKNVYQENQSEGKQIFLNINLLSPLLIIPQNSSSLNAFLVLLGNLTVKNKFTKHAHSNQITIIDNIDLFLTEVTVKRIKFKKIDPNDYHERESVVLPINLSAKVLRTLKESQVLPDLNISLELSNLDSSISLITLKLLFAILDENLNEGIKEDALRDTIKPDQEEQEIRPISRNSGTLQIDTKSSKNPVVKDEQAARKLNLELHVLLNQVVLKIVELKNTTDIIEKVDFSLLRISQMDFDYFKYMNGAWNAFFKMRALNLKDTRPDSNLAEKEMFMPLDQNAYFIELVYRTFANQDSNLDFSIDHLRINLCLPYILKLYQIAMEAISSPNKVTQKVEKEKGKKNQKPDETVADIEKSLNTSSLSVTANIKLPEVVLFAEPEKSDSKILRMKAGIELLFNSNSGDVKLNIALKDLGMRLGEYNNMHRQGIPFLSPCNLALQMIQKKGESLASYKLDVDNLLFNMTPTLYQVVMGVINTINKSGTETIQIESVNKKLLQDSEPFVVHFDSEAHSLSTKKDANVLVEEEDEENQIDVIDNKDVNIVINEPDSSTKLLESLDLNINEANIKFCEESSIDLQPLAVVRLGLKGKVSNWTKNLHVKTTIHVEATYYNDKISNWEPLIERVMIREDEYRPWTINLWFAIEEGGILQPPNPIFDRGLEFIDFPVKDLDYSALEKPEEIEDADLLMALPATNETTIDTVADLETSVLNNCEPKAEKLGNASYINIESNDLMNLNVTPSAYKVIMYLTSITAGSDEQELLENKTKQPFKFLNFLGEESTLIVSPVSILKPEYVVGFDYDVRTNLRPDDNESMYHSLESIDKEPEANNLNGNTTTILGRSLGELKKYQQSAYNTTRSLVSSVYDEKYKFCLQINGFEKVYLSLKTDGSYLIQLKEQLKKSPKNGQEIEKAKKIIDMIRYNIMFKIRTNYGRAKVIFSSPLQIENKCKIKLLILVELTEELNRIKSKFNILQEVELPDYNSFKEEHDSNQQVMRKYAVLFELLPSKIYYVPLYFAYNCRLYATPTNLKYAPALVFDIKGYNLRKDDIKEVNCRRLPNQNDMDIASEDNEELLINTNDIQFIKQLSLNVKSYKNVMPSMHANYKVLIFSPLQLINTLPFDFRIDIDNEGTYSTSIKSGESLYIHLCLSKLTKFQIHVTDYLDTSWVGCINWPNFVKAKFETERLEMVLAPTNELYVTGKHLSIWIHFQKPNEFTFYSPYWLVNKSGQSIHIKSLDSPRTFNIPDDTILLFDFKDNNKKNKVKMNIKDGQWTSPFSIDAAGTTGLIQCKDNRKTNTFLMRVTMSESSRTKLVTFAPFLLVANQLDEKILISEWNKNIRNDAAYDWKSVEPSDSIAFFPSYGSDRQLCFMLKTADNFKSKPFPLENPGRFVIIAEPSNPNETIPHKIFTVLISGGSLDPVTIVVRKYQYGDSVAKFVNLCEDLKIYIKETNGVEDFQQKLSPFESFYFIWPEMVKSSREIAWGINSNDNMIPLKNYLNKSGMNENYFMVDNISLKTGVSSETEFNEDLEKSLISRNKSVKLPVKKKPVKVYCVSYIDSTQRIILFTTDSSLAEIERRKEAATMEIFVSLKGVQISLINNVNLEIASIGITDCSPQWTLTNSVGVKTFNQENSAWLERNYVKFKSALLMGKNIVTDQCNSSLPFHGHKVLYDKMRMLRPEKGQLKRFWRPGLKIQYRTSTNLMSLKCAIYKLQIDNQLPDAYFPISFYKAPTNLDEKKPMLPFVTLDIFTEQQEVTQIYRYFDCLIQEFYMKVDKGFLLSIKDWYDAAIMKTDTDDQMFMRDAEEMEEPNNILVIIDKDKEMIDKVENDIKLTRQIIEFKTHEGNVKQSAHIRFDNFKLSPISFNLSFSVNGTVHTDDKEVETSSTDFILYFLLESIGSTISEFKDVKFHFSSFEIDNHTKTWNDMYAEIFNHFKIQTLHQAYVLIFGLDVLGNPFGLVSDFSKGLTDLFYDPLIGYLNGEGGEKIDFEMGARIKTTVNKTISSFAGSGSLITGSVGRVLATISFDKEYKRKRQYKLSKSATLSFKDSLTMAGKNTVAGMIYGVIGVVKNPVQETRISKKGIFKGIGKGISGFIVKPMGSLFDGLSISLDGLRRFAQSGSEVIESMRLPRHLIKDIPIVPFSEYLAEGYEILRDLQNDNIAIQEAYWAHLFLNLKRVEVLYFITDTKIYRLQKTYTQILSKWKENEKAIPLNRIQNTEICKVEVDDTKKKKNTVPHFLQDEIDEYELYVKFEQGEIFDRKNPDLNKKILMRSSLKKVKWLAEKIEYVIRYYKETRLKANYSHI